MTGLLVAVLGTVIAAAKDALKDKVNQWIKDRLLAVLIYGGIAFALIGYDNWITLAGASVLMIGYLCCWPRMGVRARIVFIVSGSVVIAALLVVDAKLYQWHASKYQVAFLLPPR